MKSQCLSRQVQVIHFEILYITFILQTVQFIMYQLPCLVLMSKSLFECEINNMLSFKDEKPRALLLRVKAIDWDNPPNNLFII